MPINQDTHYVIKNGIVEQPAVVKDGLELYYDAKGKHNNDVHKDTLLDLSGNNRHGTLVNFAYEGVSGYQENGTGGILLDDVDDKIVRPTISGIEYTSASRNLFDGKFNNNKATWLQLEPYTAYTASSNVPYNALNSLYFGGTSSSSNHVTEGIPSTQTTDATGKIFIQAYPSRQYTQDIIEEV